MKNLYLLITSLILSVYGYSQNKRPVCNCPASMYADTKADTTFHLSNNISIALCGSRETGLIKRKVLFREFILSVCGSNKIIKFWDAMQVCNLKVIKDTLMVESLENLPIGNNMSYKYAAWTIERIYFVNGKTVRDSVINPKLPKYTSPQIANVLSLYNHTLNRNNDKTIELADKLFISTLSNDKTSKDYLINFRNKFTNLDGIYLEEYDSIMRMLELWEKKNKT